MSSSKVTPILRIIDANLNRLSEGLRFLEELARFQFNDTTFTQQLKNMRHDLIRGDLTFNQQLIQARGAASDVGVDIEVPGEEKKRELPAMVIANARRVQQSIRVLEELAKLPDTPLKLSAEKFQQARFELYTIEQNLMSKLQRQDKTKHIAGLYVIIDTQALKGRTHLEVAKQIISGGAKIIQLRDKLLSKGELLPIAEQLRNLCAEKNVLFIMNDYLDVALAVDADGLHVGQNDLPIKIARQLLPIDKILGGSVTTVEQTIVLESEGADYIGVGAMYPTKYKETATVIGLERLHQIREVTSLPLVAIGGIEKNNAAEVMAAGANSIAVISAVLDAESPEEATRQLVERIEIPV